jgi:hypothetical protein
VNDVNTGGSGTGVAVVGQLREGGRNGEEEDRRITHAINSDDGGASSDIKWCGGDVRGGGGGAS